MLTSFQSDHRYQRAQIDGRARLVRYDATDASRKMTIVGGV